MNQLTKFLVDGILNEGKGKVIAAYGGGFKPPTAGHFEVVKKALEQNPEIEELTIFVGGGERDGLTQAEAILIWEIFQSYLPMKVNIQPSKAPIGDVIRLGKNNLQDTVYFVIGGREGRDDDTEDIASRTKGIEEKYPNMKVKVVTTPDSGMSGTNARQAAKVSYEEFEKYLPGKLSDEEKEMVYNIVSPAIKEIKIPKISDITEKFKIFVSKLKQEGKETKAAFSLLVKAAKGEIKLTDLDKQQIKEQLKDILKGVFGAAVFAIPAGSLILILLKLIKLHGLVTPTAFLEENDPKDGKAAPYGSGYNKLNENASYSKDIDIEGKIIQLTQHMLDKGYNIEPLPSVEFVDGDSENAREFLGKTAYYNPETQTIVLYTEGRHPKDIVRSFAHEMIHHIQNLEGRLGNITTTNTQEDDHLNNIEAEANLKGTMTFRNWTDSLNEVIVGGKLYPFKVTDRTYDEEDNSLITIEYKFTTPNNTYRVEFYSGEYNPEAKTFDLSFGVDKGELNTIDTFQMTGEGNAKKIFSTILNIIENFIDTEDVEKIIVDGTDEKRKRIYNIIFSSTSPKISDKIELKEAIVGDKIECDGCGWSWKIIDGGDDLFMCHKCGHDNTPLNEEKKPYKHKHGFDDKLGKDPFGLNAYARELALGLEEEIEEGDTYEKMAAKGKKAGSLKQGTVRKRLGIPKDKKIPLSLINKEIARLKKMDKDPDKKGAQLGDKNQKYYKALQLAKTLKTTTNLNEGRYDAFANRLSSIVFEAFKDIHDRGDKEGEFEFRVDHPDDEHDIPSKDFYFDLMGKVEITDDEYEVDGGANAGFDKDGNEITPLLSVKFRIPKNPDWQRVSFDIKDVVRHELEHLTQDGDNVKSGKYMEDDQLIRDLIDADMLPKSAYFRLEKEVDAMLQGLYFKAKKSKRPFKDVIDDYLNIFIDQETITQEEKENILDIWRSRGKALSLPVFEQIEDMNYEIYSDMDGVLTDFDASFMKASDGILPSEYEKNFGKDGFWELIDGRGVGYWVGMPWMSDGKQYWDYIKEYKPILLSSPSRSQTSRLGKRLWVRNNLPGTKLILAQAKDKQNYAQKNRILIDDRPSNIDQWRASGGIGILHISAADTIRQLKELGL